MAADSALANLFSDFSSLDAALKDNSFLAPLDSRQADLG
jgi:hypothetical protein